MNQEINRQEIEKMFQEVCRHKLFANSPTYKRLLEYLIEKSLAGEDLKEYTIGSDLYGIDYAADKSNGTVRSYMYKLRKKLTAFYTEEGIHHPVIFEIEKGQYNLHFVTKKKYHQLTASSELRIPLKTVKIVGVGLVLAVVLVCGIRSYVTKVPTLWQIFFKHNANNLVVISDQYMLMEVNRHKEKHAIMYEEINSDDDYYNYKQEHPERAIHKTDFTVMTKMAPYGVKILDEWFLRCNKNFGLQLESDLTLKNIKESNLVFIGQAKTMNLSKSFFLKDSKHFSIYRDGFRYSKDGEESFYNTTFGSNNKVEYAMVSFTSLDPGKSAFYFVSNNDIGVMATLRNFTNKQWLKEFTLHLPAKSNHFNALFKVSGLQRTEMSCELVALEVVE